MSSGQGIVASGHPETSRAAAEVLRAGGNAFDAVLAALLAATVAEPLLVSLGGGGYLLARASDGRTRVFDFFCQTPRACRPADELDFYPILADFGAETQQFHIGMGAIAVPGVPRGLFEVHRSLGTVPLAEIARPAMDLARGGVKINALHAYIIRILEVIIRAHPALHALFRSSRDPNELLQEGESFRNPELADALDALMHEGEALFYRGDWAAQLGRDCRESGGHLDLEDLHEYAVEMRAPLPFSLSGQRCSINPPPSPGGCLVALAGHLFESEMPAGAAWGSPEHLLTLARAMRVANLARAEHALDNHPEGDAAARLLSATGLQAWLKRMRRESLFTRGTTHVSVADRHGNLASLTASNGEGNAYLLPGTGIILNNMLGEEDLNPGGFHRWRPNTRLASMMSPALLQGQDRLLALGSGGSNRIRSAVLQVLLNRARFGMALEPAVAAPRIHLEQGRLSVESGYPEASVARLRQELPDVHEWPGTNLFFGGVHAVELDVRGGFSGGGDPRRGGAVEIA